MSPVSRDSLEADLEGNQSGDVQQNEAFSVKEVFKELDNSLNVSSPRQKSVLTERNIRGINRALVFNAYLFEILGFRINALDELIESKTQWVVSRNGLGREQAIKIVEGGTPKIEAKTGFEVDRLFGVTGGRR